MLSLLRLKWVVRKEFIQTFRNPLMRGMLFVPPLLQLILFGYAVNTDVRYVATAVLDYDASVASRDVLAQLSSSGYFAVTHHARNHRQLQALLDRGAVVAGVVIPEGFARRMERGQPTAIQLVLDGTDSNLATVALAYAEMALAPAPAFVPGLPIAGTPVELRPRLWFNENLESRLFFVPGVIASIILLVAFMLTSMSVVREREVGTLEQLLVTPLRPLELVLGKCVPFGLIVSVDIVFIGLGAALLFDLPLRGSLALLAGALLLFIIASLGMGLLISAAAHTQQQAMMLSFFAVVPITLLSGFAFPIRNMPAVIQWLTYLNPMRYVLVIERGIFLKGVGADVLYPEFLALAALSALLMAAAVLRFRQRLD